VRPFRTVNSGAAVKTAVRFMKSVVGSGVRPRGR
jgi:hypothetical protein